MASRLLIEPLRADHLPELAIQLRRPEVYEHIGGLPSLEDFILDRERALDSSGSNAVQEHWLNFLVFESESKLMLGRLEATLHDSIAEVAFLFAPQHWGKGFASQALQWLHHEIRVAYGINEFWATTVPENIRCQSLLLRSGYQRVHGRQPVLYSFEVGDLVYQLRSVA